MYSVDAFGVPVVHMNTRDGISVADVFRVPVGNHTHVNWAFGAPGEYQLTFKSAGTLVTGNQSTESEPVTLHFVVEDAGPTLSVSVVSNGAVLRVGWISKMGADYQLQYRTSVTTGGWRNEGDPIDGDGTSISVDMPIAGDLLKVFQVIEVQP